MKFLLVLALLFFVYSRKSSGTIDYEIVGCFDPTNGSDSSSNFYLLQLKEVNETCFQVEKKFANGTETFNYVAPARDGGVQIEIAVASCSIDLPPIDLSLCDEHDHDVQFNQTDFSTQVYLHFDSSEEDSTNDNRTSKDDLSKESHEDLHWNHTDYQSTSTDNGSTDTTTDLTDTTETTTETTTTTTTTTTTKKATPKPKATTSTSAATTTTGSAVPAKKPPAKGKGKAST